MDEKISQPKIECLPHGVFIIRKFFNRAEQVRILQNCIDIKGLEEVHRVQNFKQFYPWIYYNWPASFNLPNLKPTSPGVVIPQIEELLDLGRKLHSIVTEYVNDSNTHNISLPKEFLWNEKFTQKSLYCILYGEETSLESHKDILGGWVISISIGATSDFFYSLKHVSDPLLKSDPQVHHVDLDSGDVIFFNGLKLHHGISKVSSQLPEFWSTLMDSNDITCKFVRLNLQLREFKQF